MPQGVCEVAGVRSGQGPHWVCVHPRGGCERTFYTPRDMGTSDKRPEVKCAMQWNDCNEVCEAERRLQVKLWVAQASFPIGGPRKFRIIALRGEEEAAE